MTTTDIGRPTYAAISASALRENFASVRAAVAPSVRVLAIVKADGYGHSARLVAPLFEAAGADWFGVATVEEGIEIRSAGVRKPILVLTGARGGDVDRLIEHDLAVAVLHRDSVRDLAAALNGGRLNVHVKVDTGMGRVGVLPGELPGVLDELRRTPRLTMQGLFSHFGNSDRVDREYSDYQVRVFQQAYETVRAAGFHPEHVHLANSAATVARADAHFTMVRPGIVLYGIAPDETPAPGVRTAMRLVSHIVQLKSVPSEFPISYGQTFITRRPSTIAVLPIGYADGYSRALSNRAAVLVRGQRAPVVGTICMDLTMVDVSDVPGVGLGDEVVLWGRQGAAEITVDEVADWQGSVTYEVLTRLGKRVPRVLVQDEGPRR